MTTKIRNLLTEFMNLLMFFFKGEKIGEIELKLAVHTQYQLDTIKNIEKIDICKINVVQDK